MSTVERVLLVLVILACTVAFGTSLHAIRLAAGVSAQTKVNADQALRTEERLDGIEQWQTRRADVAPADVLREIQSQHGELWTWLLTHGLNCPACPPCQSGDAGEVPGS